MIVDLSDINGRSLMNVFFDIKDDPIKAADLDYLNLVFTGNGVFLIQKSRFGLTYERTPQKYQNSLLRKYEFDWAAKSFLPKAPKEMFTDILECFKYVVDKTKDELFIILYWDTQDEQFVMDIVKLQVVTQGSVKYAYNKTFEMEDRYIKYLEIHSHNTMGASFSGTDNNDESGRTMYYCGVLGKINQHSNIYSVDQKFRIWTGEKFREIDPWEVFDIYMETPGVSRENQKRLDQILAISKAAKNMNRNQTTGMNQSFSFPGGNGGKKTVFLPSTGRHVEEVEPEESIFAKNPLDQKFPTIEELSDMDDDELNEWGIFWEELEDDEQEQLSSLMGGEVRGDGTPTHGYLSTH
jgi:hypothetical protein